MTSKPTLLIGGDEPLSRRLTEALDARLVAGNFTPEDLDGIPSAVYLAGSRRTGAGAGRPDPEDVAGVFDLLRQAEIPHVVVISSAAVWEPSHRHLGHVAEDALPPCREALPVVDAWRALEDRAERLFGEPPGTVLTLLRPTPTPVPGGEDFWSRFLAGELGRPLPGYDPSLQFLDPDDLAEALRCALDRPVPGPVHVAPAGVIPVRKALELAGVSPRPRPALLTGEDRELRKLHRRYVRYPWTVSGDRARRELGFTPRFDSAATLRRFTGRPERVTESPRFDDFGMDPAYIDAYGRTLFRFLHDYYWRVELAGLEHVPRRGRVVLTGVHRGFMPFDGVMALHAIRRETGRIVRFLIHPTLVKFPFLANFMRRLGGLHACRDNAARVLEDHEILGIFPEGIRGAFSYYRDAYELKKFGRDEFVKIALRHRAPIVPFVTVGSAEIYPVWKKLHWRWWRRWSEWPCLPLGPNFPWIGVPLPSKWHTRFLEPFHVEEHHGPEAADDPEVVRALSLEVQTRMKAALDDILQRRRSIFFGNVF